MGNECCEPEKLPEIVIGYDFEFELELTNDETGRPFDFTAATEASISLTKTDGTLKVMTMTGGKISVVNAGGGILRVSGLASDTTGLKVGEGNGIASMLFTYTIAGKTIPINLPNSIIVTNPVVPT